MANLESRIAQLEQRPTPAAPPPPDLGPLEARIAALEQKTSAAAATATAAATTDENLVPRLAADEAKLATLKKTASGTGQLAERATRIARVQSAFVALSLGQPLGALPGAPPALARYATAAPPTEASLRLAFPAAPGLPWPPIIHPPPSRCWNASGPRRRIWSRCARVSTC